MVGFSSRASLLTMIAWVWFRCKVQIKIVETSLPKGRGKSPKLSFPAKYLDEEIPKLIATVKAAGDNTFVFKVTN